jgi:hypothetical protein
MQTKKLLSKKHGNVSHKVMRQEKETAIEIQACFLGNFTKLSV